MYNLMEEKVNAMTLDKLGLTSLSNGDISYFKEYFKTITNSFHRIKVSNWNIWLDNDKYSIQIRKMKDDFFILDINRKITDVVYLGRTYKCDQVYGVELAISESIEKMKTSWGDLIEWIQT